MDGVWFVVLFPYESLSGSCGVRFVKLAMDAEVWEKIHTAFNEAELHLITGILAGEGLQCRVKSRRLSQLPFSHSVLGSTEIYVPKIEAPIAQRILMIYRNC